MVEKMKCPDGNAPHCVGCQHQGPHSLVRDCHKKHGTKCPPCIEDVGESLKSLNPKIWHPEELILLPSGAISIPMKRIRPPKGAIRESFEPLGGLTSSIKRRGVLQPLAVRPLDPEWREFEPVIGCRRYFSCSHLKVDRVPCYIKQALSTDDIAAIALEENTFRKNLTRRETAKAISIMVDEGHGEEEIASVSGMGLQNARAYIKLPSALPQVRSEFLNKRISTGHLILLYGLDEDVALELLGRIKAEKLSEVSVRQILKFGKISSQIPEKVRALLGKKLFIGEGGRGVFIKISTDSKKELCQILRVVHKSIDGLCAMDWHEKVGRKKKQRED